MNEWYKLVLAKFTRAEMYKIMEEFNDFEKLLNCDYDYISIKLKIKKEKLINLKKISNEEFEIERLKYEKEKIKIISFKDEEYPFLLKQISNPPLFLYLKGRIEFLKNHKTIAIVGTRRMTTYGKSVTEKFTRELINEGITIISGLALGIDTIVLDIAVKKNGEAIAVIGSGIDVIYPVENKKLWNKIEEEGLIISEYPLGTEPQKWNFPERNRIIVGLSKGILVTESFKEGGSLITAKLGLDNSREVFAVPGFISYPSFEGCNNLIKKGEAKLVTCIEDILEEFNWIKNESEQENKIINLNKNEQKIYDLLIVEKSIDQLIIETKMKATDIIIYLMELEIKGIVKSINGSRYIRV